MYFAKNIVQKSRLTIDRRNLSLSEEKSLDRN